MAIIYGKVVAEFPLAEVLKPAEPAQNKKTKESKPADKAASAEDKKE